jgi:hypothetical protein
VTIEPQLSDVASLVEPPTIAGDPTAAATVATPARRSRPVLASVSPIELTVVWLGAGSKFKN